MGQGLFLRSPLRMGCQLPHREGALWVSLPPSWCLSPSTTYQRQLWHLGAHRQKSLATELRTDKDPVFQQALLSLPQALFQLEKVLDFGVPFCIISFQQEPC